MGLSGAPALPLLPAVKLGSTMAVALVLALLTGCAQPAAREASAEAQPVPADTPDRALLATAVFEATNAARRENGAPPLRRSVQLDAAADEQAAYMALMLRAEHANPAAGRRTAAERVRGTGLSIDRVGENVLMVPARRPAGSTGGDYSYAELAAFLVQCWMDSPPHRANLLDTGFTEVGCAARIAHGIPGDQRVFAA